jgi:predicted negative regulator of RcsB-dependent stress response
VNLILLALIALIVVGGIFAYRYVEKRKASKAQPKQPKRKASKAQPKQPPKSSTF